MEHGPTPSGADSHEYVRAYVFLHYAQGEISFNSDCVLVSNIRTRTTYDTNQMAF